MKKPFLCCVGIHRWVTYRDDQERFHRECGRCHTSESRGCSVVGLGDKDGLAVIRGDYLMILKPSAEMVAAQVAAQAGGFSVEIVVEDPDANGGGTVTPFRPRTVAGTDLAAGAAAMDGDTPPLAS